MGLRGLAYRREEEIWQPGASSTRTLSPALYFALPRDLTQSLLPLPFFLFIFFFRLTCAVELRSLRISSIASYAHIPVDTASVAFGTLCSLQ